MQVRYQAALRPEGADYSRGVPGPTGWLPDRAPKRGSRSLRAVRARCRSGCRRRCRRRCRRGFGCRCRCGGGFSYRCRCRCRRRSGYRSFVRWGCGCEFRRSSRRRCRCHRGRRRPGSRCRRCCERRVGCNRVVSSAPAAGGEHQRKQQRDRRRNALLFEVLGCAHDSTHRLIS